MSWFKVCLSPPADLLEPLSNRFFELGAQGVEEKGTQLIAYFPEADRGPIENQVKVYLTSLMEPMVILFLGGVIGGLVVSMYLPIFKLGSVLG